MSPFGPGVWAEEMESRQGIGRQLIGDQCQGGRPERAQILEAGIDASPLECPEAFWDEVIREDEAFGMAFCQFDREAAFAASHIQFQRTPSGLWRKFIDTPSVSEDLHRRVLIRYLRCASKKARMRAMAVSMSSMPVA